MKIMDSNSNTLNIHLDIYRHNFMTKSSTYNRNSTKLDLFSLLSFYPYLYSSISCIGFLPFQSLIKNSGLRKVFSLLSPLRIWLLTRVLPNLLEKKFSREESEKYIHSKYYIEFFNYYLFLKLWEINQQIVFINFQLLKKKTNYFNLYL